MSIETSPYPTSIFNVAASKFVDTAKLPAALFNIKQHIQSYVNIIRRRRINKANTKILKNSDEPEICQSYEG